MQAFAKEVSYLKKIITIFLSLTLILILSGCQNFYQKELIEKDWVADPSALNIPMLYELHFTQGTITGIPQKQSYEEVIQAELNGQILDLSKSDQTLETLTLDFQYFYEGNQITLWSTDNIEQKALYQVEKMDEKFKLYPLNDKEKIIDQNRYIILTPIDSIDK